MSEHRLFAERGPLDPRADQPPHELECRCHLKVSHRGFTPECKGRMCIAWEFLEEHLKRERLREVAAKEFSLRGPGGV